MTVEPFVQIGKHPCTVAGEFVVNLMAQAFIQLESLVRNSDAVKKLLLPRICSV
jgi:hypothetical protein